VAGGRISERSERRLVVGDLAAVPDELFPPDLAYVALGHLHLAQVVGGRDNVRYSGSPLPLALSERGYPHQVVLVDLDGERATPRPLRVPRTVELVQVPADGRPGRAEAVLAELERLPARGGGPEGARPLLEVLVALDGPDPTLAERVATALEGKEARLARLGRELPGADSGPWGPEPPPIADLTPEQVLVAKHRKDYGGDPSADLLAAFRELVDQVGREPA
jgi:exonuclease SbcD